ncbi:hypothetical protein VOLCADRAFT_118743, partial [Volvox carteri f. nagariensis]
MRFVEVGITGTAPQAEEVQRRSPRNMTALRKFRHLGAILAISALTAPLMTQAELVASITFYSVNGPFDPSSCDLLDSYLPPSLNYVPINFFNKNIYRTNCSITNSTGRVKSILTYRSLFDSLTSLENLISFANALRDDTLWLALFQLVLAGCGAEAFYTDPAVVAGLTQNITVCTNNPTSTILPPTAGTSPPTPPRPPRPPFPPGLGPCILITKAISFYAFNAQLLPDRPFRCIDDGSTNGQMIVVGTAASRDDGRLVATNFGQKVVVGATIRALGGMQCNSVFQLEGGSCGVYVRYDSWSNPDLFDCYPPPPPIRITNPNQDAIFSINCTALRAAVKVSLQAAGQTLLSDVLCTVGYITGDTYLNVQLQDPVSAAQ